MYFRLGGGFDETGHLVLAQNDRRLARLLHRRQMPDEVGLFERDLEEEPQRGARLVDDRRAYMLLGQMQLIAAKVLGRRLVRRPAEESREVLHGPSVIPLGVLAEPARRHVVDHALAQGADGLVGHRETSCLAWG